MLRKIAAKYCFKNCPRIRALYLMARRDRAEVERIPKYLHRRLSEWSGFRSFYSRFSRYFAKKPRQFLQTHAAEWLLAGSNRFGEARFRLRTSLKNPQPDAADRRWNQSVHNHEKLVVSS